MKKGKFIEEMEKHGDAVITYRSAKSRKLKYNVCTRDFSTEYIRQKRNRAKEGQHTSLLFCWDTDSFRILVPRNVTSIVPLNRVIKND